MQYVYENKPYRFHITDGDLVEDYIRMYSNSNVPLYFCLIAGSIVTFEIKLTVDVYSAEIHRYNLTEIPSN